MAKLRLLLLATFLLATASATAQTPQLETVYDALDLSDRSIPLPAVGELPTTDVEVQLGSVTCTLAVGHGVISGGDCPTLWGQKRLTRLQLQIPIGEDSLRVTLVPREPAGRPAVFDANVPVRGGTRLDGSEVLPYGGAIALYVGEEWQALNVPVGGQLDLDADAILEVGEGPVLAYTEQAGSLRGYFQFWLVAAPNRVDASSQPPSESDAPHSAPKPKAEPRVFDLTHAFSAGPGRNTPMISSSASTRSGPRPRSAPAGTATFSSPTRRLPSLFVTGTPTALGSMWTASAASSSRACAWTPHPATVGSAPPRVPSWKAMWWELEGRSCRSM